MLTTTQNRVIDLVSGVCRVPSSHIHPDTSFRNDLDLDAVDVLLLIAELENNFQVYLTSEEADAIETVQDVSYYMHRRAA
jgi:acyl carrier protein